MAQNWTPPQPASAGQANQANIPNYLILSIVSIFCCWGGAIVAMTNAAKVNKLIAAGDVPGAMAASAQAKKWAFISIGIGVAIYAIVILAYIVFFVFASAATRH